MIVHDYRCEERHVHQHYVKSETTSVPCLTCGEPATRVFLTPPHLDWTGMAMGPNAGPEFVDRFARVHNEMEQKQSKTLKEHGDYGPGYDPPPTVLETQDT